MRLYLGAGTKRLAGYTHVDLRNGPGIDAVCDLARLPWPWADDSASLIVAEDLVEHLAIDLIAFLDEAWRVMKPGGELFVRTPHYRSESTFIDPTHRWHLSDQSFHYVDPNTQWGKTYPHYTQRKWRIISLGIRGPQNICVLMVPRKSAAA